MDIQNKILTLGSLFDGSGGFPLAGLLAGITPVWASEIEPFPIRVTTKRLPQMQHLGDISSLNGAELTAVDIISFGSPCQDLSVAGKRCGLGGSRSNLFYEAVRVIKEMRSATNGRYPKYLVWENVLGAFSSNQGEDFRTVLESILKIKETDFSVPKPSTGKWTKAGTIMADGFSLAWRTLDAQYWGVPQRRRRIYLIADFTGTSAGEILFKSEGLPGNTLQGIFPWKESTGYIESSDGTASSAYLNNQGGNCTDVKGDMVCTFHAEIQKPPLVFENHSRDCRYTGPQDTVQTVLATFGTGGNNQPFVVQSQSGGNNQNPPHNQGNKTVVAIQGSMIGRANKNGPQGNGINENVSFTLNTVDKHAVAYSASKVLFFTSVEKELANTLVATDYKNPPVVNVGGDDLDYIVRRLTPTECARLQGFPDWWCDNLGTAEPTKEEIKCWSDVFETYRKITGTSTKPKTLNQIINWLKNPHSDSAEYKMWGNGVALPCVYFVMSGIAKVEQKGQS